MTSHPVSPTPRRRPNLLRYAKAHRAGWTASVIVSALAGFAVLLQPWPVQVLTDHVLGDTPMPDWLASVADRLPGGLLLWVGLAGLAVFTLGALLDVTAAYLVVKVGQRTAFEVARDLFARVQRQSLRFHATHSLGDLLSRITGDSWCVYRAIDAVGLTSGRAAVTSIAMAVVMWRLDPSLTLVAIIAAPTLGLAALVLRKRVRLTARQRRDIEGRIQSHVQQTLRGIQVVQAYAREEHEHERFQGFAIQVIRAQQRGLLLRNVATLWSGLTRTIGVALILLFGARAVLAGDITLGKLWVFVVYLRSMLVQVETMVTAYMTSQEIRAEMDRVRELLAHPTDPPEVSTPATLARARGEVHIDNVTVGYQPEQPILRGVSVAAEPGQTIAIVGPTGSGKSTLMNLLPRFFDPWSGRVTLDGVDIRTLRLTDLRRQVALVLQEPFLFPLTIAENIAYGRPEATRAEIIAAAQAANAHDFIERLPEKYDTVIGERGATLSGGEKQRVSIARAILKDAPVLILDEPTSALDTQTESLVMHAIERLMQGRTTFVIAHRLSTVRRADRIVVLGGGVIIEQGTHEELMARGGEYRRLYDLQMFAPGSEAAHG